MTSQEFSKGWDQERVKRLVAELDARTDDEWIADDDAHALTVSNSHKKELDRRLSEPTSRGNDEIAWDEARMHLVERLKQKPRG